jgi:muramoyltetrapeptide carboxypeptidase
MRRRQFLERLGPLGGLLAAAPAALAFTPDPPRTAGPYPPYLKEGDFVGITCPAGSVAYQNARYAESALKRWGLKTKIGSTVGKDWHRFAGTDEERATDFQRQLDDPIIKAIMFGRGGYGTMRMMDKINWDGFKKNPKWLIGYSDITAFHCHVASNFGIPTVHGKMALGFNGGESPSEVSVRDAIMGKPLMYKWEKHPLNREGKADGLLVGGNLSLIYAMQAGPSELDTKGKILFIEDVSEYKYTVDRMLMNLKRSGKLKSLSGLIVGGFTQTKMDGDGYFSMSMEDIILEKVKEYDYPVAFGFPAGHQTPNLALKLGVPYHLDIKEEFCVIAEPHAIQPFFPEVFGHDSIPEPSNIILQDSISQHL